MGRCIKSLLMGGCIEHGCDDDFVLQHDLWLPTCLFGKQLINDFINCLGCVPDFWQ